MAKPNTPHEHASNMEKGETAISSELDEKEQLASPTTFSGFTISPRVNPFVDLSNQSVLLYFLDCSLISASSKIS